MLSGIKLTNVPFFSFVSCSWSSLVILPLENSTFLTFPSRKDFMQKYEERAFTALIPTPFKPTDFLNTLESYLAPVFIFDATSITLLRGIPLP